MQALCVVLEIASSFCRALVEAVLASVTWSNRTFWRGVLHFLPHGGAIDAKIKYCDSCEDEKKTLEAIYKFLDALDAKAAALMQYNGIILAVVGIFLQAKPSTESPLMAVPIGYLTIVSILFCLMVVGMFWRFLEYVDPATNALETELNVIRRVLVLREACYQAAWWLSVFAGLLLLARFGQTVEHLYRAAK
ncbi:MAG: hypothetical protein N2444_09675 [Methylocystis sp.]|nr:hypothetical protein [Methylocystis sp.]